MKQRKQEREAAEKAEAEAKEKAKKAEAAGDFKGLEKQKQIRKEQKQIYEQIRHEIPQQRQQLLEGYNQPIPIQNEQEFAHLYLEEVYMNQSESVLVSRQKCVFGTNMECSNKCIHLQ